MLGCYSRAVVVASRSLPNHAAFPATTPVQLVTEGSGPHLVDKVRRALKVAGSMAIVCGVDLSSPSVEALSAAIAIARATSTNELILVHVAGSNADDAELSKLRIELDRAAAIAEGAAPSIRTELIVGEPVMTLIGIADTENAELIVIASNGHTNAPIYKLGGTSEKLAIESHIPVLIVRTAAPFTAWATGTRPLRAMVAIDDDQGSDAGLAWLCEHRGTHPIDITLAQVYYADVAARYYGIANDSAVDANPEAEKLLIRDLQRRFPHTPGLGTITPRPQCGLGRVADHLIELAKHEQIDLIVIGTSQTTGLGRFGSVSAGVVHEAPQSILCIPPSAPLALKVPQLRIAIAATDLSDFSNRAIPYAAAVVAAAGALGEVHIVHVLPREFADTPAELHAKLRALTPAGVAAVIHTHVVRGDNPAEILAQVGARVGADVACLASHGRSGITRALVGSVADKLMRATRLPVLVVRPNPE